MRRNPEEFRKAFARGDTRGFEVGAIGDALFGALPRVARVRLATARTVVDKIRPRKLRIKHPEVGIQQYLDFQDALDTGHLVLKRTARHDGFIKNTPLTMLVHVPDGNGAYWVWVVKIPANKNPPSLVSIYRVTARRFQRNMNSRFVIWRR